MSITLTTMRYFLEAAEQENFSVAASRLYTAQPNLSKKIASLEQTLGIELFRRDGRHVRLTPAGRHLYTEWAAAMERIDRSVRQARLMEQERLDTLTIGVLEGMGIHAQAPRHLEALRRQYPALQLRLERAGIQRLWREFASGVFDLIVLPEVAGRDYPVHPDCERRIVDTSCGAIAINVQNPMAEHSALTLPMLSGESFVVLSQDEAPQSYRTVQEVCRRHGFTPRIIQETSSVETLLLYVEMGVGVALLVGNTRLLSNPNVRLIPLEDLRFNVTAYWHTSPARPILQALASAMDQA